MGDQRLKTIDLGVVCWSSNLKRERKRVNKVCVCSKHLGCTGKEAGLVEKLVVVEKEKDDLLDKNREARGTDQTNGRRACFQNILPDRSRKLCHNEYKKSLSDVFNQAIAAGWSKGVKVERTQEDAVAILAGAADYDPHYKDTFMSAFDSLFTQSYPYGEKIAESFRLPLGDLQNMWPEGIGPTLSANAADANSAKSVACTEASNVLVLFFRRTSLGRWHLDSSEESCVLGNVRHLAIGTWTHSERLAFWEMYVTWPLALGLIRSVLRSGKCTSLGASCIPQNVRHWPLVLRLIWSVLRSGKCTSFGQWHLDSSRV
nr:hypothetical protein [Tanacetum cinerariifolium]